LGREKVVVGWGEKGVRARRSVGAQCNVQGAALTRGGTIGGRGRICGASLGGRDGQYVHVLAWCVVALAAAAAVVVWWLW
jgi:hypothetical protein